MSIKLVDVVKRFSGEGDVVAWIDRLELVLELQGGGADCAKVIPLFLEGAAYDVYAQMNEEDRACSTRLKSRLVAAFGLSPSQAFAKFKARTLMPGESPDAFLAELRRLARTAAAGGDAATVDQFVLCQFVDGLPEPTRSQLHALKSGGAWNLAATLECAKGMLLEHETSGEGGGLLGRGASGQDGARGHAQGSEEQRKGKEKPKCYGCGQVGHLRRQCQSAGPRCYGCGQTGHLKRDCTIAVQGNEVRGSV